MFIPLDQANKIRWLIRLHVNSFRSVAPLRLSLLRNKSFALKLSCTRIQHNAITAVCARNWPSIPKNRNLVETEECKIGEIASNIPGSEFFYNKIRRTNQHSNMCKQFSVSQKLRLILYNKYGDGSFNENAGSN